MLSSAELVGMSGSCSVSAAQVRIQLFYITDNEMLLWPQPSLLVSVWSMRLSLWPLSAVGLCVTVYIWNRDQGFSHGVHNEDVTRLDCSPCYCQATKVTHFPHQGKTDCDVWHVMVWWCMSAETGTWDTISMYYLCFSLYLTLLMSPNNKAGTVFKTTIQLEKINLNFISALGFCVNLLRFTC